MDEITDIERLIDAKVAPLLQRIADLELAAGALTGVLGPERLLGNTVLTRVYNNYKMVAQEQQQRRQLEKARRTVQQLESSL